jgi:tRNA 2-thiouridine synthesizing protein A
MIDARGLSCPEPVILAKRALDGKPENLTVMVDNRAARENVTRLATALGYRVEVTETGRDITLSLKK